ncbi:MAG TPA: BamA/TamA family outer membrane protein [Vicinamibacterales bacterium]|nr:BamA/TamA family outer membrane protein [Vicinamibacterales bacterium]
MSAARLFEICTSLVLLAGIAGSAPAQTAEPQTRRTVIEEAQSEKVSTLQPYVPSKAERVITRVEDMLVAPSESWHPFFENAYSGGGFAPGLGYMRHVSPYSSVDFRGSYSIKSYKRAEAEFVSSRLFHRRGQLSILGGWRDATQVAFYGFGTDTSKGDRTNFGFEQPYGSALFTLWPTRRLLMVRGGFELSRWDLKSGSGAFPSADEVFTPATLPGLGTTTTYLHTQATVGFDWRTASGYGRRGGLYGVTGHDYTDRNDTLGFRQVDYEVVQHVPILRESWVLSLHGLANTTWRKTDQEIPFFMMPSLGGGSTLRGYSSWRFRDRNSVLLQAEWRIMVNRFFDTAVFSDAGQVAAHKSDFDLDRFKTDYGFGVRFHTPFATVLRVDVARSREGTTLVFATSPVF